MSTELGKRAEGEAANYLENIGFKILAQNWRNRYCEIDIVAKSKDGSIHFVEVKQRAMGNYGAGLEYITQNKSKRLKRAAQMYMAIHYGDAAYQIDVISIDGNKLMYLPNAVTD
jgi:putative endonuclease